MFLALVWWRMKKLKRLELNKEEEGGEKGGVICTRMKAEIFPTKLTGNTALF